LTKQNHIKKELSLIMRHKEEEDRVLIIQQLMILLDGAENTTVESQ